MSEEQQSLFDAIFELKQYHEKVSEFLKQSNILIVSRPSTEYSNYIHIKAHTEFIQETLDFVEQYLHETYSIAQ